MSREDKLDPECLWVVPKGWDRGEDLEFKFVGQVPTLQPARLLNNGPPSGLSASDPVANSEIMAFRGPNGIEECNRFALWWFQSKSVRTIWTRPTFEYRPQSGRVIEGEAIPAGRIKHKRDYDL